MRLLDRARSESCGFTLIELLVVVAIIALLVSIPVVVARTCKKPLIVVKASGGIRSWIRRWI